MTKSIRALAAIAATQLLFALPAKAGVMFESVFLEQWFTVGQEANNNVDTENDWLSFEIYQDAPGIFDLTLDAVVVTFDTGIVLDTTEFFFLSPLSVGVDGVDITVEPGDESSFVGFQFFGFDVNDFIAIDFDLDDSNAVVRGTNGSGVNRDFAGSFVDVLYTFEGDKRSTSFTYGACNPASPSDCSSTSGRLDTSAVPAPMSIALVGIGLLGLVGARRKRAA